MATLKFILRKSRRGNAYTGKICARITQTRRSRVLTLPVSLYPEEWDEQEQEILFNKKGSFRYRYLCKAQEILTNYREQFEEQVEHLEKQGHYTAADINIDSKNEDGMLGLQNFANYLSRNLERAGQGRTARAYQTACRAFTVFNGGYDVPLKHINSYLIKEFETYLKERSKAMNTISYYMRMLRAIYQKAIQEKVIKPKHQNPFEGVFTGFKETRKRALNVDQLRKLNNMDFSMVLQQQTAASLSAADIRPIDKGLYDCWRFFFFCFHARGMSFVDMAYLRKDNIRQGIISYYRKKTGQKIEVTVTPILKQIIDSFADEVKGSPYLFPIIRDPDKSPRTQYESGLRLQNNRLKRLSRMTGIEVKWGLTTHVSRHSWATTGKTQNLPLSVISEGLGHSSEKMTYTYLASFDRSTLDKASEKIAQAISAPQEMSKYSYSKV